MFDCIFEGATVIDGTNQPRFVSDVGIVGSKIAALGDLTKESAQRKISASGKILAPGFIDVHNHSDGWLRKIPHFRQKTDQGFTTEILMSDGISYAPVNSSTVKDWFFYLRSLNALEWSDYTGWESLEEYMRGFDRQCAQNVATLVPYANARTLICGFRLSPPTLEELAQIQRVIEQGMEQGAVGLSTGLEYLGQTYASTEEIVSACKALSGSGVYVTHVRYPLGLIEAVKEAVEIGKKAKVPVHISHLKTNDPKTAEELFLYIDTVAVNEVDFTFDIYPYSASSTMLNYLLPYSWWEEGPQKLARNLTSPEKRAEFEQVLKNEDLSQARIAWLHSAKNKHLQGRSLQEVIDESKKDPASTLLELLAEEELATLLVFARGEDDSAYPFIAHPKAMLGTDGIYHPDAPVHPRMFGSPARILGPLVREKKLFSLETAVYKMTGFPAKRFGLEKRGVIREGYVADLVVFDAERVCDRASYKEPCAASEGVAAVFTNGVEITKEPIPQGEYPGRYLRFQME